MLGRLAVSRLARPATIAKPNQLIRMGHAEGPGTTMPFQIKNKNRLLFVMCSYLGLGFAIPFIAVRFQMYKKSSA